MLFVRAASQIEGGESGQNAGKTGFSEPSPGHPGEGRTASLCLTCDLKVSRVCVCVCVKAMYRRLIMIICGLLLLLEYLFIFAN